jgi:hypothetical protein
MLTHIMTRYVKMIEQIEKYPLEYEVGDRIELLMEDRLFKVVAVGVVEEVV